MNQPLTFGIGPGAALDERSEALAACARDVGIGESCDGLDLGGQSCATLGYTGGSLSCAASCQFDTAACGAARCGPGHSYRVADDTCTATLLSDPAVSTLIPATGKVERVAENAAVSDGKPLPPEAMERLERLI